NLPHGRTPRMTAMLRAQGCAVTLQRLRRAQTFLRTVGIKIAFCREGRFGTRTIRITAIGENQLHDTVSTVSRVSDKGDGATLNDSSSGLSRRINWTDDTDSADAKYPVPQERRLHQ